MPLYSKRPSPKDFVGKKLYEEISAEQITFALGCSQYRIVGENDIVTMEYIEDRVNIHINSENEITDVILG